MHGIKLFGFLMALLGTAFFSSFGSPSHGYSDSVPQSSGGLSRLSWMSGDWETSRGDRYSEEHWIRPAGKMMLGVSRTLAGDKTVSFEFMRIEERADGIYYVAQPHGRTGVDFKLVSDKEHEAVFENPGNTDHLKHIIYRKNADGSMTARIEGEDNGKPFAEDYPYSPMGSR